MERRAKTLWQQNKSKGFPELLRRTSCLADDTVSQHNLNSMCVCVCVCTVTLLSVSKKEQVTHSLFQSPGEQWPQPWFSLLHRRKGESWQRCRTEVWGEPRLLCSQSRLKTEKSDSNTKAQVFLRKTLNYILSRRNVGHHTITATTKPSTYFILGYKIHKPSPRERQHYQCCL